MHETREFYNYLIEDIMEVMDPEYFYQPIKVVLMEITGELCLWRSSIPTLFCKKQIKEAPIFRFKSESRTFKIIILIYPTLTI